MPGIRIDDEVFNFLKQNAEPLIDTPNSVLRRLLNLEPSGKHVEILRLPAESDQLPKQARGILATLQKLGGRATVQDLIAAMPEFVQTIQKHSRIFEFYRKRLLSEGYIKLA